MQIIFSYKKGTKVKENEVLRAKFKESGYDMISEFIRGTGSKVNQEAWGRVLRRDERVGTVLLLQMAAELCTPEEIKAMLIARGEESIARLIAPAPLSAEDKRFLDKFHAITDSHKKKLVFDMLDNLKG